MIEQLNGRKCFSLSSGIPSSQRRRWTSTEGIHPRHLANTYLRSLSVRLYLPSGYQKDPSLQLYNQITMNQDKREQIRSEQNIEIMETNGYGDTFDVKCYC